MASAPRRVGAENSATRALILDATEQLIREEGYAAVSTRRVAAKAGLKPSLVHYYFTTTDDLLLAMSRRGAEESDRMIEEAGRALVIAGIGLLVLAVGMDFCEGLDRKHPWNPYQWLAGYRDVGAFTRARFQRPPYDALVHFSKSIGMSELA